MVVVSVVVGCGTTQPPESAPSPDLSTSVGFEMVEFHGTKLAPRTPIRVVNQWGNIEIRTAEHPGSYRVQAAVQRIGRTPPQPPVFRQRSVEGVAELVVEFPGARIAPDRTGRVDLALFVPPGHPLSVETRDGLVKAKKTANPLHVRTADGPVQIINDGPIRVRSDTGRVQVRPMYRDWDTVDVRSERGVVVAFLPTAAAFELEISGTSNVYSAFPLVARAGGLAALHLRDGAASNRVRLVSAAGIEVHEAHLAQAVAASETAAEQRPNP